MYDSFLFVPLEKQKIGDKYQTIQETYSENLMSLSIDFMYDQHLRRKREVAWLTHRRRGLYAAVAILSQLNANTLNRKHVMLIKKVIRKANATSKTETSVAM